FFVIGWISTFVTIIQLIPISIAGLGIREASYAVLLNEYGISPEQAISLVPRKASTDNSLHLSNG
ncbi:MAG: lysylphosphatidylglycerol synthase domain-containing protein, partial [Candidatus Sifarchaeia archaeon]